MLENVRYSANNNISFDDARIKSSDNFAVSRPSFKANPNAVDNTPTADTYQSKAPLPSEMSMGEKFLKFIFPTWMGLHFGTKAFDKANSGEYEKSLVGRLGKLGDRISASRIVQNDLVRSARTHGSDLKRRAQTYIDNSPMLSAMQKTPTKPTCSLVTNFLESQSEADIKAGADKLFKFIEKGPKSLEEAGATKDEINALKAKYGTNAFGKIKNLKAALREFQIDKMGFDPATIPADASMQEIRLTHLGITEDQYKLIKKDPHKYARHIERGLEEYKGFSPKLSGYLNKIKSIHAPATKLGKLLPKIAKMGVRGLTFGGGFWNSLFVAFFVGGSIKDTFDAPKEQKASTLVNGLFENMSWIVAMPLAVKAMHSVNGLKNLGKTEAQVKAYESAKAAFDQKAAAGLFGSKGNYERELAKVKALRDVGVPQKGFKKALVKVAQALSVGLDNFHPYTHKLENVRGFSNKSKAFFSNLPKWLPNVGRNWLGYPIRFALYMFAFQPVVDKLFTAPITALLGKPYDPEKAKEEHEKEAERISQYYDGPAITPNPAAVAGLAEVNENNLSDKNLVKQKLKEMNALPPKEETVQTTNNSQGDVQTVNGVQINTITDGKPYMPQDGVNTQNGTNGIQTVNGQEKDPNKSDYDTVPRTYVPQIDWNNPFPYSDPMANPNAEKNYDKAQKLADKMDKMIESTNDFMTK